MYACVLEHTCIGIVSTRNKFDTDGNIFDLHAEDTQV